MHMRRSNPAIGDIWHDQDDLQFAETKVRDNNICHFGITEVAIAAAVSAGIDASVAAVAVPALLGAGLGAATSAISGGDPLNGALMGGITGGVGSFGGALGSSLGIGATAGSVLAGGAGGALGAFATGGDPLKAALMGGAVNGINQGLQSFGGQSPSNIGDGVNGPGSASGTSGASSSDPVSSTDVGGMSTPAGASSTSAGVDPTSLSTAANSATSAANSSVITGSGGAPDQGGWLSRLFGTSTPTNTMGADASGNPTYTSNSGGGALSNSGVQLPGTTPTSTGGAGNVSGAAAGSSPTSITGALGKVLTNPMALATIASTISNSANRQPLPTQAQQQASTQGGSFNSSLPQYSYTSTRAPIANYYQYGYSPQQAQITNTLKPMATGGRVSHLAGGGVPMPHMGATRARAPAFRMPHPSAMPRKNVGGGLAMLGAMAHARAQPKMPTMGGMSSMPSLGGGALGMAKGGMPATFARDGQVDQGTGTGGQADKVPAMLSEDEYVMPADVTSSLGDGSPKAGSGVLDQFVSNVRAHKAVKGQPPKAKPPAHYLPKKGRK